jgi:4-deoxy-L-threo-5-hexosulose-uronate ketol-isomerase
MKVLHQVHPEDFAGYSTSKIREKFLLEDLVAPGELRCVYTHYDRMVVGAATPAGEALVLGTYDELKSEHFLSRREIGIINIADAGTITVDGEAFDMARLDCLYIGKGKKDIRFASKDSGQPSKFIFFSAPAHMEYPVQHMRPDQASPAELGSLDNNNHRVINKYIHPDGLKSCQLVIGVTSFKKGSIWNTMPSHLHDRRMEAYFYFGLPEGQRVIHFMGEPQETRHMFLNNEQAIISPAWSIHSGVATASYSFIWAMAGENMSFSDMDPVPMDTLR